MLQKFKPTLNDEILELKERAKLLGLPYTPSMGTRELVKLFPYYAVGYRDMYLHRVHSVLDRWK